MTLTHILVDYENTQPGAQEVALVTGADLRLWIFRGPSQKKYDAEFAEAMMSLGERVQVVRCEKSGRNALDMHIAFQLGRLAAAGAQAPAFVIVSRDTDYEPLLQYLQREGVSARRVATLKAALGAAGKDVAARAAKGRATPAREARPAKKSAARPAAKSAARGDARAGAKSAAKTGARNGAKTAARSAAGAERRAAAETDGALIDRLAAELQNHPKSRPVRLAALRKWLASRTRSADEADAIVATLQERGVVRASGAKVEYPAWG